MKKKRGMVRTSDGRLKRCRTNDYAILYRAAKRAGLILPGQNLTMFELWNRFAMVKEIPLPITNNKRRLKLVVDWIIEHEWDESRVRPPQRLPAGVDAKKAFYASWEWRTLRMKVLQEQGRICQCCRAKPGDLDMAGDPVKIVVDHIKPLSKYWELRLVKDNLQVLCDECNVGKGAWDETDYRPQASKN